MSKKMEIVTKKNLIKYLIEFVIVAFGVFLGIYLNNKETDKKSDLNQNKAIENIINELENNNKSLKSTISYHELIKTSLDSLFKTIPDEALSETYFENKKFKFIYIKNWSGNGFTEFDDTAFEVSKMSGTLQSMDIDLIQEISKIYKKLNSQSNFQNSINNRMANINSQSTTYDAIGNVILLTGDNLGMEKSLSTELENSIETIKTLHNNGYK
ncbi:hypothetical protein [Winogradskyella poriferorum]|uniref:Uncharacterized protein n=1 Tax=Winogradskyella poriferorum TaxID=307627 RepID=A0ABU7W3U7_9FLAO